MTLGEECEHGSLKRKCLICELLDDLRETRAEVERLREIHRRGCECSTDDACQFARERDEARAEVERLTRERDEARERAEEWRKVARGRPFLPWEERR
jgi:hypothetical protein